jgi:tRNA(fMet)-specific endonuclease VapC
VSFHEQTRGAHAYVNQARTSQEAVKGYSFFERILTDFSGRQVLIFDGIAAAAFDLLRTQKPRIGTMDLRIAAIALSRNMTLLTRNLRDFQRVPGLKVEDWTV